MRKWAKRLAYALRALLGSPVPVIFWDERLTTFAANEILSELDSDDIAEDAAAAAVILQSYLDARAGAMSLTSDASSCRRRTKIDFMSFKICR